MLQVNDEYATQIYTNSAYISLPLFQFRKTNRTHKALNVTFLLKENVREENDLQVNFFTVAYLMNYTSCVTRVFKFTIPDKYGF